MLVPSEESSTPLPSRGASTRRYSVVSMDCPTCGLANPPGTSSCDCGYDFTASKPADFPGWPIISLAWRQKVAAYWSISWPAWIGSLALVLVSTSSYPVNVLEGNLSLVALAGNLAFFGIQAILCHRLVRKNYRSFRVYVIREDGTKGRSLSMVEGAVIWLWIFTPQLAFLVLASLLIRFGQRQLPLETVRGLASLSLWLRFLAVGPYAVGLAMHRKHHGFMLQAYGLRYV